MDDANKRGLADPNNPNDPTHGKQMGKWGENLFPAECYDFEKKMDDGIPSWKYVGTSKSCSEHKNKYMVTTGGTDGYLKKDVDKFSVTGNTDEPKGDEEELKNYVDANVFNSAAFKQNVGPVVKAACEGLSGGGKRKTRKRRRKRGGELKTVEDAKTKVEELTLDQKNNFINYAKGKFLEKAAPPYLDTKEKKEEAWKNEYCSKAATGGGRRRRRRSRKRKSRKRRKTRRKRRKSRRKSRRRKRRTKRRR